MLPVGVFFPFNVEPFSKGVWCIGTKQEVIKLSPMLQMTENMSGVSGPPKFCIL